MARRDYGKKYCHEIDRILHECSQHAMVGKKLSEICCTTMTPLVITLKRVAN
ncbi:hypothetical protein KIN20_034645 [Parelaphostrongylus tenuis]|uniref:Uncharacterized protein n=1 Tax=Parelaphostrongylus tenuis TaxID=148309 RepID=A0AAD5RAM6_PARTN|nr:hypothetical protein KIN20_034645 [Parelaphostrongylus tenuis]